MNITPITKKIMIRIGIVAANIIAVAFLLILFTNFTISTILLFSVGVIITSALNCFKIYLIEQTALKISNMDVPEAGKGYAYVMYILRYLLTAIVVVIVVFTMYLITGETPFITYDTGRSTLYDPMIIGLIVGLFTMKIAVISAGSNLE